MYTSPRAQLAAAAEQQGGFYANRSARLQEFHLRRVCG